MRTWVLLLTVILLAGCQTTPPTRYQDCEELDAPEEPESSNVRPDGIFELEFGLEAGQSLYWHWCVPSGTEVAFNVHRHVDDEVVYLYESEARDDDGFLEIEEEGIYFPMWENPDEEWVTVTYAIWVE